MAYWRKYHPKIGPDDRRYHQVSLIYSVLIIMLAYFSLLGVLNVTLFDAGYIAIYDFTGAVLTAGIYWYLSRFGNFKVAGWLVIGTLVFVLLAFIHLAEGQNYSLLWVTILPPLAFFILGPKAGTIVTSLVFAYCSWFLYGLLGQGLPGNLSLGALFNFVEVAVAQIFLFRYYETSRRDAYEQLHRTAITDPLTRCFNRLHLDNSLNEVLNEARRTAKAISILLLDVDHFKRINDEYGHIVGDKVLIAISQVLQEQTREEDLVGRWGGEEFLIICPDAGVDQAAYIAERILQKLNSQTLWENITATVSIGIATSPHAGNFLSAEAMSQIADRNLYRAKEAGRNRVLY